MDTFSSGETFGANNHSKSFKIEQSKLRIFGGFCWVQFLELTITASHSRLSKEKGKKQFRRFSLDFGANNHRKPFWTEGKGEMFPNQFLRFSVGETFRANDRNQSESHWSSAPTLQGVLWFNIVFTWQPSQHFMQKGRQLYQRL